MPAQLPDDIWDQERLERQWYGLITPEHPLYPALLSLLRHCNTMSSAEGVALRIKHLDLEKEELLALIGSVARSLAREAAHDYLNMLASQVAFLSTLIRQGYGIRG